MASQVPSDSQILLPTQDEEAEEVLYEMMEMDAQACAAHADLGADTSDFSVPSHSLVHQEQDAQKPTPVPSLSCIVACGAVLSTPAPAVTFAPMRQPVPLPALSCLISQGAVLSNPALAPVAEDISVTTSATIPSLQTLWDAVKAKLSAVGKPGWHSLSLRELRQGLNTHLGLEEGTLDPWKGRVRGSLTVVMTGFFLGRHPAGTTVREKNIATY